MILAAMAGGAAGILTFIVTGAGLVATPSPGSIFAYAADTPRGGWFGVFAGVLVAAGVSFAVGAALLGFGRLADRDEAAEEAVEAEAAARSAEQVPAAAPATPAATASPAGRPVTQEV
jgi:mannitol-specific phosphotransferase system IIBC component